MNPTELSIASFRIQRMAAVVATASMLVLVRPAAAADRDSDRIDDADDWCPRAAETYNNVDDEDACPDEEQALVKMDGNKITILEKIAFASGRSKILPTSKHLLDRVATVLKDNAQIKLIEIQGHTDNRGDAGANQRTSERRAKAVLRASPSTAIHSTSSTTI